MKAPLRHTLDSELLYMARKVLWSACFASSSSPAARIDTASGTATEGARPVARTGTVGLIFLCPFLGASLGAPASPVCILLRDYHSSALCHSNLQGSSALQAWVVAQYCSERWECCEHTDEAMTPQACTLS